MALLRFGRGAAVAAIAIGGMVLIGFAARIGWMVRLETSLPPMYPNTAIALLCGGTASLMASGVGRLRLRLALTLAVAVLGIGTVGLILHLTGAAVGWYEALWPDDPFVEATTPTAGRPVVETCVSLMMVGTSLVLLARQRAPRLAQALSLASLTIGLTALIGFLVGVDRTDLGSSLVVGMALHTAVGLIAVSLSALLARPGVGAIAMLTWPGSPGRAARLLAVGALAVPLTLALAQVLLTRLFEESRLASSMITVMQVGLLGALVVVPLALLERSTAVQRLTEEMRRRTAESAGDDDLIVAAVAREVTEPPPELPGWTVALRLEPAHGYLAGDSQQILPRNDGSVLVAVVDVAGHGAAAGIVALRLRAETEALWRNHISLEQIGDTLDATVVNQATIATCFLGELDLDSGELTYLNAGHPAPLHMQAGAATPLEATRALLGLNTRTGINSTSLRRGDLLILHTDGVTEARDPHGDQLGDERLHRVIRARSPEGPDAIAQGCIDAALEHTRNRLRDDALVVALRRD